MATKKDLEAALATFEVALDDRDAKAQAKREADAAANAATDEAATRTANLTESQIAVTTAGTALVDVLNQLAAGT